MRRELMIGTNIIARVVVGMGRRLLLGWGTRREACGALESFIICAFCIGCCLRDSRGIVLQ